MKKVVLLTILSISVGSIFAQLQEKLGVKTVVAASSVQYNNLNLNLTQTRNGVNGTFKINSVSVIVGTPYRGVIDAPQTNNPSQNYMKDLGFPWGIRYRYSTFSEDAFTVSKGYYTDKVSINWGIKNNSGLITSFLVYRSTDIAGSSPDWGNPIVTLASSARSFDDINTEGGKLYKYKVVAVGVESVQNIYSSYIVGIGYRNPTAVITGNVSFSAGNPVKNVLISATPTGTNLNFGSSLKIPGTTYAAINRLHKPLNDSLTLQAWVKPETNFNNDAITIYEIKSNVGQSKYFKVKLGQVNNRTTLTLTIEEPFLGDQIITLSDYMPNGEVDNKGADVLVPISNVNGTFTHFTAVLRNNVVPEIYINGRLINASYADKMNSILASNTVSGTTPPTVIFTSSNVATRLNTSPTGYPQSWTQINLGGGKTAYLDELRVWETALAPAQILTDYRRYLKGNESYLHTYLTANEGAGDYAYDLSSTGFSFHGNDAKLNNSTQAVVSNPPSSLVQNGLVVNLDPGQTSSYPGTGNTWTNTGTGGSTYNANLQNSPSYSSNYGGSFILNGTNQSTQISRPVQDDFTLSAWFKTTSTAGDLYGFYSGIGIIDGEVPGSVNDFGLTMGNGKLIFGTGNPDVNIFSTNTYNDNKWHNVVCTRVKSTGVMVMYVDGVQIGTATGNTNSLNVPNNLTIGVSQSGKYFPGSISVINMYNNALNASQVQQNYNYFYTRFTEPVTTFSNTIPTNTQLGILGVTDQYGNFVISAVPYTGNGNSYTLVPSIGKHQFNPTQQLVYVGVGSTVINNVNFKDISSFTFNGLAAYDSRGVFPTTSDAAIRGDIKENESYNAYTVGNQKYQKGQYWAFKNTNGGIDSLRRYAVIPVPGAYVNIDNQPAIDANNVPVMTDLNGRFSIQVPIGQHAITLVKSGHTFLYDGRFPANTSSVVNGQTVITNTYQDFYQDQIEPVTFIDTTKITVIGRVVGGSVQAGQTIGFGDSGKKTYNYVDAAGVNKSIVYTSINNIGAAKLTLGYTPVGSSTVTPEYKTSFQTNAETGEFRVKLLPLSYSLSQNDLTFISGQNPGNRPLLDQDKTINFTAISPMQTPSFTQGSTTIKGTPYQEVLKYTYFANPSFNVLSQSSDAQIVADGNTYSIASDQTTPIYSQFGNYQINIQAQETYSNYDQSITNPVISTVPVSGGQLIATNNLALANSDSVQVSTTDSSVLVYSFRGGIPNTDPGSDYKRTINLLYRLNGVDYPITNYKTEGILLGGVSDGTQTFVTAGPQIPEIILRDPPGSNSSATIDKGSSFTFSKESSYSVNNGLETSATIHSGFELSIGGSITGPIVKTDVVADYTSGVSMSQSASNGISVENTYSFNQSISTSDDPSWDGSDADLYIGYSANQYYGTYNNLTSSATPNGALPIKVIPNAGSTTNYVYPKMNKAIYFNEAPQKTFFIYSQRSILNDIIPKYQNIINQIDSGIIQQNTGGVLSRNFYINSINLWRKVILNNELSKYNAFNDRDKLKASLNTIVNGLKNPITNTYSASAKSLINALNATFFQNISFDAGVGQITKSYEVERVSASSLSYDIEIDASVAANLGTTLNETGFEISTTTNIGSGYSSSSQNQNSNTANVSYTLKASNAGNLLSVDVINPFDGNGPIFITKGGQTSCPYEGAELTHFYNPQHPNVTDPKSTIVDLSDSDRIPLSLATVPLEKPEITVVSSNISGVYDGRNAEFILKLRNTSTINADATFLLTVDQTTNPDNALFNIDPNGTIINIPAGQTVTYTMTLKKVKQDQFNYNNIKVSLQSLCDGNATSSVLVSASFVPACSPVNVTVPSNNWLLNRNTAYDGSNTKPLNITLSGYNTSFTSFQKINLEYRLQGTPNWTGLKTYYKNAADTSTAIQGGDNNVALINGNQLNYQWDIAGLGLSNGSYELRARTTCYNSTAFESPIIVGMVSLDAPVVFGTPTPKNGILGIGDDITVRFNKPIKTNGTVTKFEFLVQQNQLPVSHQVSLAFNGITNTATINKPYITTGDLSIEFWMKNASPSGTSTLLSQSGGLKIELIDNVLKYTLGGQSISATILKDGNYNHYTLSYNSTIPKLSIIENDKELSSTTSPNPITVLNFTNANPIIIGGSSFKGNIHDLRFWSKPITRDQSVANMNLSLTGSESGILGLWPMNEGNGSTAKDVARFKSLDIANANWDIFPKGTAYDFSGTNYLTTNSNTFSKVIISKEMDATVTFWMKTAQSNATIISNGKGDSTDVVESNQFRNKWAFNTNANGGLELAAEGKVYSFGSIRVNDNSWHHVAVSLTRNGGLQLYIDGNQMGSFATTNIGGLASTSLFIGARGQISGTTNVDRYFIGQVDELCIWNMARTADQIKTDMYYEQNYTANGLLFYSNFNKPAVANSNGPKYYYPQDAFTQVSDYMQLNTIAIIQTGLVVNLDPAQTSSYPGSGNLWTNIGTGGATYNATLQNAPTFTNTNGGNFTFNGTNQGSQVPRGVIMDDFTLSTWFKTSSNAGNLGSWWGGMGLLDADWPGNANDFGLSIAQGKLMFGTGNPTANITSPTTYNDNNWHNVICTRTKSTGALVMYVDGIQVASGTGNTNTLNSPGQIFIGNWNNDRFLQGSMSAVHMYSNALSATQAKNNYDALSARFSGQSSNTGATTPSFTDFTPSIKPYRSIESIVVNPVINNDQIVLVPAIANWASIEGKVAYITVSNLNDMYDNRQVSPITWSAYINKNPIKMFVEGQGDVANLVKTTDSSLTFQITIVNQGGLPQPYSFNVPSWLSLSSTTGTIDANKSTTILATVDMNLAPGIYNNIISLTTNYGIDKKLPLNLRVLVKEPVLNFNPANYTQSMNIVGKIKVNGLYETDVYDKVYAVGPGGSGLEMRGKVGLTYDKQLDLYNVFLTVYSNVVSGENINFFIWDASQGNFLEATLDSALSVPFIADKVIGNYTSPSIFENTNVAGQVVNLNQGWTWVSFNVNDPRFSSLNNLTAGANLSTSDLIQSNAPALFDSYQYYAPGSASNGWSGGVSSNGGISTSKMYKFKLANANQLKLKGIPVDLNTWSFNLQTGWNWLPFVANKNIAIGDALANLNPSEGDIIKSQNLFSIYSSVAHTWKGSLTYLNQSEGYMINVAKAQTLTYPTYLNRVNATPPYIQAIGQEQIKVNGGNIASNNVVMNDVIKATPLITADYSKYAFNMNAVVKLPEGYDELYLYNDAGELRGNSKTINVDGQPLAFITIYGNKPEQLTAHIGSNSIVQPTTKTFNFSTDAVLGTIASPILIELPKQEISIYPNPFHEELKLAINSKEKGTAKVIIYSLVTSQTYYSHEFSMNLGMNVFRLLPNVPTGAYVIKVQIGDDVILNKIIKD